MPDKSAHDFELAKAADELLDYTLIICSKRIPDEDEDEDSANEPVDKKKGKKFTRRFPEPLYPKYVQAIIGAALEIHQSIIIANEERDQYDRLWLQRRAMGQCIYLNHLTRIAADNGWISEKQAEKWRTLSTSIRWSTYNWIQSDDRRFRG